MSLVWLLRSATSAGDSVYGDYALEIGANGSMARDVALTIDVDNSITKATIFATSSNGSITGPLA